MTVVIVTVVIVTVLIGTVIIVTVVIVMVVIVTVVIVTVVIVVIVTVVKVIIVTSLNTVTFFYLFFKKYIFFKNFLSIFGKSNLTHLTTDVTFSGQRFAILAMFVIEIGTIQLD